MGHSTVTVEEQQEKQRRWAIEAQLTPVLEEANKKFNDAIYRVKNNDPRTAQDVWDELKRVQESDGDGWVVGLQCTGLLNQLARRGQIPKNW